MAAFEGIVIKAFRELSVKSSISLQLKKEQKETVNCLLNGRDVFAVMLSGHGKKVFNCSLWR